MTFNHRHHPQLQHCFAITISIIVIYGTTAFYLNKIHLGIGLLNIKKESDHTSECIQYRLPLNMQA